MQHKRWIVIAGMAGLVGLVAVLGHWLSRPEDWAIQKVQAGVVERDAPQTGILGIKFATAMNVPLTVEKVLAGSGATEAGVLPGDTIVSVGTSKQPDFVALQRAVQTAAPGDLIPITIGRGGADIQLKVRLMSLQEAMELTTRGQLMPASRAATTTGPVQPNAEVVNLPSFGLSITAPTGWTRSSESKWGVAAEWIEVNRDTQLTVGRLQLRIDEKQAYPTLSAFAGRMAGGHIARSDAKLGGLAAVEVAFSPTPPDAQGDPLHLAFMRCAEHGRYYYSLLYYTRMTSDISPNTFEMMGGNVRWIELKPPGDALASRGPTDSGFVVPDAGAVFVLPDPFRKILADDADSFATYDYAHDRMGAKIKITILPAQAGRLAAYEKFIENSSSNMGLVAAPTWNSIGPGAVVSPIVSRHSDPGPNGERGSSQFILWTTPYGGCAVFQFDYFPPNTPETLTAYSNAVHQMAKSIVKYQSEFQ